MASLPISSVIEVTYLGTLCGQRVMNTLHYRVTTPSTMVTVQEEMAQLATRFTDIGANDILTKYRLCVPESMVINSVVLQPVYFTRYRKFTYPVNKVGLSDPTEVPNIQAAITFWTEFSGRDQVGGVRIPASYQLAASGYWQAAYTQVLEDLADFITTIIIVTVGGGVYAPVIYHRKEDHVPKSDDIKGYIIQPQTRVLRRRTVGLGI